MAAASDLQAQVSDLTKCPICLEDYTNPKSLPCLHTFCLDCLESHCRDKLPGDVLPCPVCRDSCRIPASGVSAFPLNFFVNELVGAKKAAKKPADETLPCDSCIEAQDGDAVDIPPALKFCVDCIQPVCDRCSRVHAKMKTGAHLVVPLGEETSSEVMQLHKKLCEDHPNKTVELYCYDCRTNICAVCVTSKHNKHNIAEIGEAAGKLGQDLNSHVTTLSDCIANVDNLKQLWDAQRETFLTEADKLKATAKQKAEEKKILIDDHVDNLLEELDSMKLKYTKEVECTKDRLDVTAVAMQSYINYSQALQSKGSSSDVTHAAEDLKVRADTLLQTYELAKNVESPEIAFLPADDDQFSTGKDDVNVVGRWKCDKLTGASR